MYNSYFKSVLLRYPALDFSFPEKIVAGIDTIPSLNTLDSLIADIADIPYEHKRHDQRQFFVKGYIIWSVSRFTLTMNLSLIDV